MLALSSPLDLMEFVLHNICITTSFKIRFFDNTFQHRFQFVSNTSFESHSLGLHHSTIIPCVCKPSSISNSTLHYGMTIFSLRGLTNPTPQTRTCLYIEYDRILVSYMFPRNSLYISAISIFAVSMTGMSFVTAYNTSRSVRILCSCLAPKTHRCSPGSRER